jgi:lysophospholipase L1-like esterase
MLATLRGTAPPPAGGGLRRRLKWKETMMLRVAICCLLSLWLSSSLVAAEPTRVACVGDSITFGSGVENREKNNYPAVLGRLLGEGYEVRNFGVGGATLQKNGDKPYWSLDAFKEAVAFEPQIVVIKLGTNDSKPQNWHGAEQYEIDLQSLVTHFRELRSKPKVYLCTPVPVHKDAFGIRESVVAGEVVPAVKKVAERTKTPVIDLYAALKNSGKDFPDGVHPNAAGAKRIAETVATAIRDGEEAARDKAAGGAK